MSEPTLSRQLGLFLSRRSLMAGGAAADVRKAGIHAAESFSDIVDIAKRYV